MSRASLDADLAALVDIPSARLRKRWAEVTGRPETILKQRERIKRQTIEYRRLQHRKLAA